MTANLTEILKGLYYEQLYTNKVDNLKEMDKFLERHSLLKLTQEEIDNLSRPMTSEEI